jgi:phosphatidylglycerophosphate synthase
MEWTKSVYKKIHKPALKTCLKLGITANQITILNHILTLTLGCYLFSRGTYLGFIFGLALCLINGFLDYLDGDLARSDKNNNAELGAWLDCGFDVIIQNAVLGSIGIGCFKMGMPLVWIVLFFIGNTASNFVSYNYNSKFGFDSYTGNELFRNIMSHKNNGLNIFFRNLIDPTSTQFSLMIFTYRYFIALGCLLNIMPYCFIIFTILTNIKWFIMFVIYALYIRGDKHLHVFKALSTLDEERTEFYSLRYSKEV